MEICTRFCVLFFGLILLLSCFLLFECKKLDGYNFPVYSTKHCPKNKIEWNQRSTAINCTEKNGYVCLPSESKTELLEFCYTNKFILIQEGICLYLSKRDSALYSYNCTGFLSGCPNTSYMSENLFEKPDCTSIGNGCFLAEPSCQSITDNIYIENSNSGILGGATIGVFIIILLVCYLVINHKKEIETCTQHNDIETQEAGERVSLLSRNQHAVNELDEGACMSTLTAKETEIYNRDIESVEELPATQALIKLWQEDNKLFVETKASKEVERLISCQNIAIVTGHSGSGKSAIVHHIALNYRSQGWNVKPVYTVVEIIQTINSSPSILGNNTLFVLNDPIGKESFDEIEYNTWRKYEDTLKACLKNVKLLMSCRKYILNDGKVKGLLKDRSNIVDISNDQLKLSKNEKEKIWSSYAFNKDISSEELTKIVQTEAYFPLLCKLCFSREIKEHERVRFFREPVEVLEEDINIFRKSFKDKYCALVLLVLFNNDLCVDDIQDSSISIKKYGLALKLCEMRTNTAPHTIDDALETLLGFFVKKIIDNYHFYHDFVMEVTTYVFGKKCPLQIIEYADIGFLRKRVTLQCLNENSDQFTIHLNDKHIGALGKRLFKDIFGDRLLDVVLNPCLKNEKVICIFINELKHHPEKFKLLLEKQKLHIDTQEINQTSNHLFLSKLEFVSLEEKISPLSAIIIFCDTRLSLYCLKALQQMPEYFTGNSIFSSVCCNGSKDIYAMFIKDHIRESLAEKWKFLYPIHIASAFNNNDILRELLKNGADANLKTTNENYWTPLTLAAGNQTEENIENEKKKSTESSRNETVELLLSNGADIDLCKENGASPLYLACQEGHDKIVQLLLSKGADINRCTKNGDSPIAIACQEGHESIVQTLVSNGAAIQSSIENFSNPLFKACQEGNGNRVKLLLDNGADANLSLKDGTSPLYSACQKGHDDIVQILLDNKAKINLCKTNGASPLYVACQVGNENIVQILLSYEAHINLCMKDGASPLYIACQEGRCLIVELLLRKGADINLCTKNGASSLYIACQKGYCDIVKRLLKYGADVDLCVEYKATPLIVACQYEQLAIVQLLLNNGADINFRLVDGTSCLTTACEHGYDSIVQLLLSRGADINLCIIDGASPLFIACHQGHDTIVQLLLENGANLNACNEYGASPLFIACHQGHDTIVQRLLENGANLNASNEDGASPLFIACENGFNNIIQLLLSYGAKSNLCNEHGKSPLFLACEHGYDNIVQLLLSNGASMNLCPINGASPLHIACKNDLESIANLLIRHGANINARDEYEASPLNVACQRGYENIVQLLLSKGADINLCDKYGVSPLDIARQRGHSRIVQLLQINEARRKIEVGSLSVRQLFEFNT